MMKAALFDGKGTMKIAERPMPTPGPGETCAGL